MLEKRKIIHVDMDAFFASVEQRDDPTLRGKPVIVGGDPCGRGVVAACSYEARRFGIHSAMSCSRAVKLCPRAIFLPPRKERYCEVSQQVMAVFQDYTNLVEPLSLDEAFLDITENHKKMVSATWAAQAIREDIRRRTGLTASAGVSYNKFLAKVASDVNKPNGLTVIPPEKALDFIHALPIRKFYGVGRVTEQRMYALGIKTGFDLQRFTSQELVSSFGRAGLFFYAIARGVDGRTVEPRRERKSIGREVTFTKDVADPAAINNITTHLVQQVADLLAAKKMIGRTLTLKVRYEDFQTISRSSTSRNYFSDAHEMMRHITRLLAATEAGIKKVRLLGVTISSLQPVHGNRAFRHRQLLLPFPSHSSPI